MINVIATIKLNEGCREAFLTEFRKLVPVVLEEDGCIEYGPTIDVDTTIAAQGPAREDVVTVIEKWDNIEALESHLVAPHMLEYRATVKDLVAGAELQITEPA
ncbi:MAG: antibiotic biosynthesis monooxygenase [Planctomycetales bacterium]|nr:antibiotic biosynthesis monooxygenase [Planctomycetales bacterium]